MKSTRLIKAKKTCPFIQKYFNVDLAQQQVGIDFYKKFGGQCPYLVGEKMKKRHQQTIDTLTSVCKHAVSANTAPIQSTKQYIHSKHENTALCLGKILKEQEIDTPTTGSEAQRCQYSNKFSNAIDGLKQEKRYRVFNHIERAVGKFPKAKMTDHSGLVKEITVWCSNDYLGMSQEQSVQDAMIQAVMSQGVGAGGTRNIGGSSVEHVMLEKDLADFHDKEAGILCTSGFVANQAAMNSLAKVMPDIVFLSDEKNHASIIEGMKNSRAEKVVWKHNDIEDLEKKLQQYDINKPKCIVFESVYSMSGNVSPIDEICNLAKKYNALTFIDEVHAIGLYGPRGGGVAQQLGIDHKLDFISGTLSKGIGCYGGYVVGSKEGIDCIRSFAPNFIFTSSIPPSVAAATRESLRVIRERQDLRDNLHEVSWKIKKKFYELGIRMEPSISHIVPVFIGDAEKAKKVSDILLHDYGHYIQPINFPTVARGEELLRISPTPHHTEEMIEDLAECMLNAFEKAGVKLFKGEDIFMDRGQDFRINLDEYAPFDSTDKEAFFQAYDYGRDEQVFQQQQQFPCSLGGFCKQCTCLFQTPQQQQQQQALNQ